MVNVAILGTGFGRQHLELCRRLPDVKVVGVFGRNPELLRTLENEHGVRTTADIDRLISDPAVDLVDVCLPTSLHSKYALQALEAGKHVYVETPVTSSVAEAEQLERAAAASAGSLFVDLFIKFSAPHKYAIDTVTSGAFGRPLTLTAYNKTPPVWGDLGLGRIVMNFMLHNFDFAAAVMGVPSDLTAVAVGRGPEAHVVSTLKYPDGFAVIESSSMMPGGFEFDLGYSLSCESATIVYGESAGGTVVYHKDGKVGPLAFSPVNEWELALGHVVDCIEAGVESPYLSIADALKSLRIAAAVNKAIGV